MQSNCEKALRAITPGMPLGDPSRQMVAEARAVVDISIEIHDPLGLPAAAMATNLLSGRDEFGAL